MSGNNEDEKADVNKTSLPLDLASKLTQSKPLDVSKGTPLVMSQAMRPMRLLTQQVVSGAGAGTVTGSTISIVPQTIMKQGDGVQRALPSQSSIVTLARPTHITLTTSVVAGAQSQPSSYHVPRGPAVVANLAPPRSAVASPAVRGVTAGTVAARQVTPAWHSQARTVGGSAPRAPVAPSAGGAQRPQTTVVRPPSGAQIFKPGGGALQQVTVAQVVPSRNQTLVYSTGGTQQFTGAPRLALTGIAAAGGQRPVTLARGSAQVMAARLAVPVSLGPAPVGGIAGAQAAAAARLTMTPGAAIYTTGTARIAGATQPQQTPADKLIIQDTMKKSAPRGLTVGGAQTGGSQAVVIGTQAGGRLSASVVSLHPVVVATSQAARAMQQQQQVATAKVLAQHQQQAQPQTIQLAQVAKLPSQHPHTVLSAPSVTLSTPNTRTINVSPATLVSQVRPVTASAAQAIPLAKVLGQAQRSDADVAGAPATLQNVYIHTTPVVRRTSPGPPVASTTESQRGVVPVSSGQGVGSYSLPSGTTYYYDSSSGYTVATGGNVVARPFTGPSAGSFASMQQSQQQQQTMHGLMSGQPTIQFSPVMVVEQKRTGQLSEQQSPGADANLLPSIGKVTSSPRPSILRKRDNDNSPLKAAKNLAPVLAGLASAGPHLSPPSSPRPDSRGAGSSGGSTTVSATSSPGPEDASAQDQALAAAVRLEPHHAEVSPRKKPRKQQLGGGGGLGHADPHDPKFILDAEMLFISEARIKKEREREENEDDGGEDEEDDDDEEEDQTRTRNTPPPPVTPVVTSAAVTKKPAAPQLLQSYRQTWKSTHNHYQRYSDVRPKDERRPSVMDLANQQHVQQKINGWKVHHLSGQMDELAEQETRLYERLAGMLGRLERQPSAATPPSSATPKELDHVHELVKGNMQRSRIINDNLLEAKAQVMKVFNHKDHVADIISRCASKRNFKKRPDKLL